MCIYCDYCVYHNKSTELVSLYTLDIGLKINIIIIIKCTTSSLPSKSCPSQRMEEKTGGEGTCRLSQPVRRSSHMA